MICLDEVPIRLACASIRAAARICMRLGPPARCPGEDAPQNTVPAIPLRCNRPAAAAGYGAALGLHGCLLQGAQGVLRVLKGYSGHSGYSRGTLGTQGVLRALRVLRGTPGTQGNSRGTPLGLHVRSLCHRRRRKMYRVATHCSVSRRGRWDTAPTLRQRAELQRAATTRCVATRCDNALCCYALCYAAESGRGIGRGGADDVRSPAALVMRSVRDWLHRWLRRAAAQCSTCLSWDWALPCHICAWIRFGSHREQLRAAPFLLRAALHSALRARGALAAAAARWLAESATCPICKAPQPLGFVGAADASASRHGTGRTGLAWCGGERG
jgi:hypothetical protein